jgi:hypothetical protein
MRDAVQTDKCEVSIVSCDILGHSVTSDEDQIMRVAAINEIVADAITSAPQNKVIWASGGDGGHVAFRQAAWQEPALRLITQLHTWATEVDVPLRITGHRGPASPLLGADGRTQLVGVGMNYAGWLLRQVTREGVVVSDAFRRAIEHTSDAPAIVFHDPRLIPNIEFEPQLLYLMSTGSIESKWLHPEPGDQNALKELDKTEQFDWDTLYYVKRVWQVNSHDEVAERVMLRAKAGKLTYRDHQSSRDEPNPFLENLNTSELNEILQLGQLVERRRGELICRYDDPGDVMFIILQGTVGVFNSEGGGFNGNPKPKHVQGPGEIVGELAYALSRNRTADLTALTNVALLAFNSEILHSRLPDTATGRSVATRVDSFISFRVLQHVCDNATFLLGQNQTGPLGFGSLPSHVSIARLRNHCELINLAKPGIELKKESATNGKPNVDGIYILVAGRLHDGDDKILDGREFPLLWVLLPDLLVEPPRVYRVDAEPITILRLSAAGVESLVRGKRTELIKALPRALRRMDEDYEFDVFISYTSADWDTVSELCNRLDQENIKYWLDRKQKHRGVGLATLKTIEQGLRSSRYFLACLSRNYRESDFAQLEMYNSIHRSVRESHADFVIPLVLDESADKDDVVPLILQHIARLTYSRADDVETLVHLLNTKTGLRRPPGRAEG